MTKLQKRLTTAFATGAVLLNALAPFTFADTAITVSGNGTASDNSVTAGQTNTTTVNQTNSAAITNTVQVQSNTGGNTASDNTGGNTSVTTGGATTDVAISNMANSNQATLNGSTGTGDATVSVSGNGSFSDNTVRLNPSNTTTLNQTNTAAFTNNVNVAANTGRNDANDNTGGTTSIDTGATNTTVTVGNAANANTAMLSGTGAGMGTITAGILGNGTQSDNTILLGGRNTTRILQNNTAAITNNVGVNANTGRNDANDNTGGDVAISTGNAAADVTIDNMANFNGADLGDYALTGGLTAKILGNGSFSDNTIRYYGANGTVLDQYNSSSFTNNLRNLRANTGQNDANDNTGFVLAAYGFDPVTVDTGMADTTVSLSNSANMNQLGSNLMNFGTWLSHHVSFDLGGLFATFM